MLPAITIDRGLPLMNSDQIENGGIAGLFMVAGAAINNWIRGRNSENLKKMDTDVEKVKAEVTIKQVEQLDDAADKDHDIKVTPIVVELWKKEVERNERLSVKLEEVTDQLRSTRFAMDDLTRQLKASTEQNEKFSKVVEDMNSKMSFQQQEIDKLNIAYREKEVLMIQNERLRAERDEYRFLYEGMRDGKEEEDGTRLLTDGTVD